MQPGILIVGHGSRRDEANADVRAVAKKISRRGGFELVETAFLEIVSPTISEGFARLVERGARSIIVHPYFLSPGRHTRGDLPVEVADAATRFPHISWEISEPLAGHDLVVEASVARIRETFGEPNVSYRPGKVYLVGAGPGDPELLTLKAHRLLAACDVVVHDSLVGADILDLVPARAERIYVGKIGGGRQTPQRDINRLLIDRAGRGECVVRLKGGDPFLFGRGGEEALALREAGIALEVVPGVSSALAAPAYAGIPVTHRGLSSSVTIVTGTGADGLVAVEKLAAVARVETLVILMGVSRLQQIAADLIAAGRSATTPVAVTQWGTLPGQRTVTGTLATIAAEARLAGIRSPAAIVVGEVVRLHEELNWFENDDFARLAASVEGEAVVAA